MGRPARVELWRLQAVPSSRPSPPQRGRGRMLGSALAKRPWRKGREPITHRRSGMANGQLQIATSRRNEIIVDESGNRRGGAWAGAAAGGLVAASGAQARAGLRDGGRAGPDVSEQFHEPLQLRAAEPINVRWNVRSGRARGVLQTLFLA